MRILNLGTTISPFGDAVGDLPFLYGTLSSLREEAVASAGVDSNLLTFADYAFATAPILKAFVRPTDKPLALALPAGSASEVLTPVSSARREEDCTIYDIFLGAPEDATLSELRQSAEPVIVSLPEEKRRRELPRVGAEPYHLLLPANGIVAAHVEHWVHMLWTIPLLVPAAFSTFPGKKKKWRGASAPSLIGEGADIHPSAFLEGSIIDQGAEIGAACCIRHSYIGPRSKISDFTKIGYCVMGKETHTLADATFQESVSLGGGTLANLLLRDTLLGMNAFLTTGVIFWNESIEDTIRVEHNGERIDTERKGLGGCAGHGCVLGARAIIEPGRALPNRTTVVMRKEEGVAKVEGAAPDRPMCWDNGALLPVERVKPGYLPDEVDE